MQVLTQRRAYSDIRIASVGAFAAYVCRGKRPTLSLLADAGMPQPVIDLIVRCWDAEAAARPRMEEVVAVLEEQTAAVA
jgi:hypothetical protein